MDLFGLIFGYHYHYGHHWRYGANEKSRHAKNREDSAKTKFDAMKKTMEATMIETTINEERASNSHLKVLPTDALNNVYGYLLGKEFENDEDAEISNQLDKSIPRIDPRAHTGKVVGDKQLRFGIDFSNLELYEAGNKITVPLLLPNFHLTQACFRDVKAHVRKNKGWDLKRIACTDAEKKRHKVTRQSKAYFVNAIYTVPGTPSKKKKPKKAKKALKSNVSNVAAAPAPDTKKRAATARKQAPNKRAYPANPAASAALQAVLASAQDGDGVADAQVMQNAFRLGYSKAFLDAKIEEQEALNVKPAAKKTKTN